MPIDFKSMRSRANTVADAQRDLSAPRGGGLQGSIFDLSRAPYPLDLFKLDRVEKDWEIDILALPTENPNNPMIRAGLTDVGEWHFHLSVDVHQFLAGSNTDMICLKALGKQCPACKQFFAFHDEHNKGLDKDDPKRKKNPYSVSKRSYMLVRPRKGNPEGKIFLFNASGATREFVDSLLQAANNTRGGKSAVDFAHPENGAVVAFDTVQGKMAKHFPAVNFGFIPRPAEEGLKLWDRTFALDSLLKIPTAAEMEEVLYGAPPMDEDDQASKTTRDEYRREESDVPPTHRNPDPVPGTDKYPATEPQRSTAPAPQEAITAAPKASGCPKGLEWGKSCYDKPEPKPCKTCDLNDKCMEAGC